MGYTHYFKLKPKNTINSFTKDVLIQMKKTLDYWQEKGVICYECNQPDKPYNLDNMTIRFNGKEEEGFETFYFSFQGFGSCFCKTGRKKYDQCVCEILILLKEYLKDELILSSDGHMFYDPNRTDPLDPCRFNNEWEPAWKRLIVDNRYKITWVNPWTEIKSNVEKE